MIEIRVKRGTATYLAEQNPVLDIGEPCLERTTQPPQNRTGLGFMAVRIDKGEADTCRKLYATHSTILDKNHAAN